MRRLGLLAALLLSACRPSRDLSVYTIEDPAAHLPSRLELGNPAHASYLLEGFHQIEESRWRWSARQFAVSLKPPFASAQQGAVLHLTGNVSPLVLEKAGPLTLTARIAGQTLPAVTFAKPGDASYSMPVPPALLASSPVRVDFALSAALAPGSIPGDGRELGLIVSQIAFEISKP